MRQSTKQIVEGNWRQVRGAVQEYWGDLTDDDLDRVEGQYEQLIGTIEKKTGESRREIENVLEELINESKTTS